MEAAGQGEGRGRGPPRLYLSAASQSPASGSLQLESVGGATCHPPLSRGGSARLTITLIRHLGFVDVSDENNHIYQTLGNTHSTATRSISTSKIQSLLLRRWVKFWLTSLRYATRESCPARSCVSRCSQRAAPAPARSLSSSSLSRPLISTDPPRSPTRSLARFRLPCPPLPLLSPLPLNCPYARNIVHHFTAAVPNCRPTG